MILKEFEVRASILVCGREEASSQVRGNPKGGGLAFICKCFLYELHVVVTLA